MKKIIALILLNSLILAGQSQTLFNTDGLNDANNVYLFSLTEYCKSLDSLETRDVYVIKKDFIGNNWPQTIGIYSIHYVHSVKEYRLMLQGNKKNTCVVGIGNLELRDGTFFVEIIPFQVTLIGSRVHLVNDGGLTVYFYYNSEDNGLIFNRKEWTGI